MNANRALGLLYRELSNAFGVEAIVDNPDHPLLLRAPDLLASINGTLTAVFSPQAVEERNPAHLATRLISSRLALPAYTKTALLISDRQEERFKSLFPEFSLVTKPSDRAIGQFLADRGDAQGRPQIEPAIRKFVLKQMDRTFLATESGFRANRVTKRKNPTTSRSPSFHSSRIIKSIVGNDFKYTPMNRTVIMGEISSILKSDNRQNLRRQIINTTSGHILESFKTHNGYVSAVRDEPHMAIAYRVDDIFGLRDKITMASAFSGVFLVPDDDPEVIQAASSRWRKTEARVYD